MAKLRKELKHYRGEVIGGNDFGHEEVISCKF
jgi:hypothetical protein